MRLTWAIVGLGWPRLGLARTVGLECGVRPSGWLTRAGLRCAWGAWTVRLRCSVGPGDRGDGAGRGDHCWTALVHVVELLAVLRGFALVLKLRGHGRNARPSIGYEFGGLRSNVDAATAAVVRDAIVVVDDDRAVIHIRDAG